MAKGDGDSPAIRWILLLGFVLAYPSSHNHGSVEHGSISNIN